MISIGALLHLTLRSALHCYAAPRPEPAAYELQAESGQLAKASARKDTHTDISAFTKLAAGRAVYARPAVTGR